MRRLLILVVLAGACLCQTAWADSFTFDITLGNTAISSFPGPYVQVTVDRTSPTTADITFRSLTTGTPCTSTISSPCTYLMGGSDAVDVNVNAQSFAVSNLSALGLSSFFTSGPLSDSGAAVAVDGQGSFNLTIKSFDGFRHSSDRISFTVTNTSGTWSSAGQVLFPNANGNPAAAHVFVESASCTQGGALTACSTGFGGGVGGQTPEPASLSLLGAGLLGIAGLVRRVGRRKA